MAELQVFDKDPNIYLFTSLTAGSSHIITATSRIETILKANKIPFIGLDTATHELGKKLFQRRGAGKKLPLLVKEGYVLGGIEEIEEWNEYDELHEALGVDTAFTANPPKPTSLFEPAPSKTPPPLAGALPGGFSFGDSVGSAFGSLGSIGGGSKAKENKPVASAEQNLAIRQMGAEAAKIAASKKPAPVKISTTNPLLTEKTNAKSPADVLSPKSTPLPKSPNTATTEKSEGEAKKTEQPDILSPRSIPLPQTPAAVPKLEQKPVHALPKIRDDAENPALSAGPVKTTQAKKESSEEEEEDSEEEETSGDSTPAKQAEQTQEQDPKDASKAGASVKEGEQEEESSEEESEDSAKAAAVEEKMESKAADAKGAAQPKQSSSEETSEEEEEDDDDDDEEESKEEEKKQDTEKDETKKAPNTDAKDASKAGESVLD